MRKLLMWFLRPSYLEQREQAFAAHKERNGGTLKVSRGQSPFRNEVKGFGDPVTQYARFENLREAWLDR